MIIQETVIISIGSKNGVNRWKKEVKQRDNYTCQ